MTNVFIIAEAGVNHNGDLELAKELIEVAAEAGADAVKFQTFRAEDLVTREAKMAEYQTRNTGQEESQFQMLKRLELEEKSHKVLLDFCRKAGIEFMSTPFDEASSDFLEALGVRRFKMGSGELTNLPFLEHVAAKGLPMIVSTGMAKIGEVETAVEFIENTNSSVDLTLLHCVSNYPASPEDINLRSMQTLSSFGYPVGYSDHTLGIGVCLASVALGARVVEKHFTLDRNLPGPDHKASLTPSELRILVEEIRSVEACLGSARKRPAPSEKGTAAVARKSLVTRCEIPAGTIIGREHLVAKRPGNGFSTSLLSSVVGRRARATVGADVVLSWEHLE